MLIDYATGLTVATLFNNSPKSQYGGIESNACWKGLARKFATLLLVIISVRLDLLLETNYIHTCVIIAFITNELISITENVGLMGLPLPKVITNVIEVLKGKEDEF